MKFGNTLLLCSFFVYAADAAPMQKVGGEGSEQGEYGSLNSGEQTAIKRRTSDDNEESKEQQQRSSGMTTAADLTLVKQQDDISIDSSEELINQKIAEAQGVEQKWSAHLEQKSTSINEEEITTILQEATADLEYWNDQKKKISSWLGKDGSEETKVADLANGTLFLQLSTVASEAIEQVYNVVAFYGSLLDAAERTKPASVLHVSFSKSANPLYVGDAGKIRQFISETKPPANQLPFEISNPLNAHRASDFQPQQLGQLESNKTKVIKIPSKQGPLAADNLKEVLETWSSNAEIRYDSSIRKYVSEQFQPNNMLDVIRCAAVRTSLEREQNRDAIKKVALNGGLDGAERFKKHFFIRVKSAFGEPLTPSLIEKVQHDLEREDRISARNAIIYTSGSSSFGEFVENIATRWRSFRRGRSGQYQTIPSDFPEVAPAPKGSDSYQGLQPNGLNNPPERSGRF